MPTEDLHRIKLLVVIACFGSKNEDLLRQIIGDYRNMDLDIDVVVVSNIACNLGLGVEVLVGLPSENPWSLPFAHKAVFARNVDRYDLFAYSEDDMSLTERNIRAFQLASSSLASTDIAGFLRYEVAPSGAWSLPDVHGGYRWKPDSVRSSGDYTVAEFTNEHAACYLLTRDQLRRMVAADGFDRRPYEGRYDMLCTAATDPYTSYGLRKVICISAVEDFLIHHRSNRYAGKVGVSLPTLKRQIRALTEVAEGHRPASTLVTADSMWPQSAWAKNLYECRNDELLSMIAPEVRSVLSVGCGWGATEEVLCSRGIKVTAMPFDSIIGAIASDRGLHVSLGSFDECISELGDSAFDCVMMTDLLHLMPDSEQFVERCSHFVGPDGTLVIGGPNFGSVRVLAKRAFDRGGYRKLRSFRESGINTLGPGRLRRILRNQGLEVTDVRWSSPPSSPSLDRKFGKWGADQWVLRAQR